MGLGKELIRPVHPGTMQISIDNENRARGDNTCFDMALLLEWEVKTTMLSWALIFLIVAIIAGILGFSGIAGAASNIAWILFVLFLVLFLVSLVRGRRGPRV
jgi:uncharacterized membrane protein YtjA (UPF0391 family)